MGCGAKIGEVWDVVGTAGLYLLLDWSECLFLLQIKVITYKSRMRPTGVIDYAKYLLLRHHLHKLHLWKVYYLIDQLELLKLHANHISALLSFSSPVGAHLLWLSVFHVPQPRMVFIVAFSAVVFFFRFSTFCRWCCAWKLLGTSASRVASTSTEEVGIYSQILTGTRQDAFVAHSSRQHDLLFLSVPAFLHILHRLELRGDPHASLEERLNVPLHLQHWAFSHSTWLFHLVHPVYLFVKHGLDLIH